MIHQDRITSRTRERDQTHSYWYIPSAPRVNYSLLIMETAWMMKMATSEGSPLRQGAKTRSQLVFGGYRGLRRRNSRSILFPDRSRVYGYIYRRKKYVRGATRGPRGRRAHPGGGSPDLSGPPASCLPRCFLGVDSKSPGLLSFQK